MHPLRRLLCRFLLCQALLVSTLGADEFDELRLKWRDLIVGTGYNPADPTVASKLSSTASSANSVWNSMNKTAGRTFLWSDAASTTDSSHITTCYNRLRSMALAYATPGCSLYGNATLLSDTIGGLDWMNSNRYNSTINAYGNWWDWQIGTPMPLNDICVLIHDQLDATRRANYMAAVEKHSPTVTGTGANLVWKARVVAIRGCVVKSSAKIAAARDSFSLLFPYVTSGDGFYDDGGFIQHGRHPYTGGYGNGLLSNMAPLMTWLAGSSWAITDPKQANVFRWVFDTFEPVIYRGAMWDPVRGREIARTSTPQSIADGGMEAILRIAQFAPSWDAMRMKSMLKHWALTNTSKDFVSSRGLNTLQLARDLMEDPAVIPRGDLVGHCQFPSMDRVVHHAPGFAFGLSMCSKRIYNFESINGENLQGWFTGDGMTTLYNADLDQYADNYWPTIDPYRLPGVTADPTHNKLPHVSNTLGPRAQGNNTLSPHAWVGGASLGNYGTAGMQFKGVGVTLTGKKSWFMFDDEIVCLGAGITSTDSRPIETTVENRRIHANGGRNEFHVNGVRKSTNAGWSEVIPDARHAWLAGSVTGADIGYYFPQPSRILAVREARAGAWADIRSNGSTTPITRNYLRMTFEHGTKPSNSTYQYVLLPGRDARRVGHYADRPHVTILANNGDVQAVRENNLGITAANFWNDASKIAGPIKVNKKASVVVREDPGFIEVAVSDPTQANTGSINVEISAVATMTVSASPGVTITSLSPKITFTVATSGSRGKTFHARFYNGQPQTITLAPEADAYVHDASPNSNFGSAAVLPVVSGSAGRNRRSFLRFHLPVSDPISSAKLSLWCPLAKVPGVHGVSKVSDSSWAENAITWNNQPSYDSPVATWTPVQETRTEVDVTSAIDSPDSVSLALHATTQTSDGYVNYASREDANPASRPSLTIQTVRMAPTVRLTSPQDGANLLAPGLVTISAEADSSGGTVASVSFHDGETLLGTVNSEPFSLIAELGHGPHWIKAVATDSNGLTRTSISHRIDVAAPPVAGSGTLATMKNSAVDVDLRTLVADVDTALPELVFGVGSPTNGTVTLLDDGYTARFTPAEGYKGAASFSYTVTDNTSDSRLLLAYPFLEADLPGYDASGNGRHGTLHVTTMTGSDGVTRTGQWELAADAPVPVSRRRPNSLRLIQNGNDPSAGAVKLDRFIPPSELDFRTSDWTATGWFKRDDTSSVDILFHPGKGTGASGSNELLLSLWANSQTLELRNRNAAGTTDVSIRADNVATGVWHHFAVVRSGGTISLYLNGVHRGSDNSFTITMDQVGVPVSFGGNSGTGSAGEFPWRYLGGSMADLALFSAPLSASEVARVASMPVAYLSGQTSTAMVEVAVSGDPLEAEDLVWDNDAAAPGIQGGSGVWNTTNNLWWDGALNVSWSNLAPDRATFDAGAPLTTNVSISLAEPVRVGRLAFLPRQSSNVFAIIGSQTLTLHGTPEVEVSGGTSRIDTPLSGGFVKAGNGRLIIGSTNEGFSETVTIQGDRLQIGNGSTAGSLGTANIVNNASFVLRRSGSYTLANSVSGSGSVSFQVFSNNTINLNPANPWSYSGSTIIEPSGTNQSGGKIRLGSHHRLPTATRLVFNQQSGSVVTFDLNGHNQQVGSLASGAGVGAANTIITNSAPTAVVLTVSGGTDGTCAALLSGNLSLVKDGSGRLTLTALNTYTGSTTVDGGSLSIQQPFLSADASVIIASGAMIDLGFTGDNVVGSITVAGVPLPPGRYNAAHPSLGSYFSGGGSLVIPGAVALPDYDLWSSAYPGLSSSDPAADPDNDSLSNFEEYAFGLDPSNAASSNPVLTPLDPATGRFRYTRRDPALGGLAYRILTSTDLVTWSEDTESVESVVSTDASGVQTVETTVSALPVDGRIFVRVAAE